MKFINNLKIREKLSLLFLVLLLPLIFFVINSAKVEIDERVQLIEAGINLEESELITNLVHELQKERGLSAGFLASEGTSFSIRLQAQRIITDEMIRALQNYLEDKQRVINQGYILSELLTYRKQIDNLTIDNQEWNEYYNLLRDVFLRRINNNANRINDQEVRLQLTAHANLANAKQYMGQLRTHLNIILTEKSFDYQQFNLLGSLYTLYRINLQDFTSRAADSVLAKYRTTLNNQDYLEVNNFIFELEKSPDMDISSYDPLTWFAKFTIAIDDLREVEILSIETLKNRMTFKLAEKHITLIIYFSIVLVALIIAFSLAVYIIRYINNSIYILKNASDQLSYGLANVQAPIYSKDELGELAASFRNMSSNSESLSFVAKEIGQGNYDISIPSKGPQDILGNALQQMKASLKSLSEENEIRSWLLNGISRLNDIMGGVNNIPEVSQKIIGHLCDYTSSGVGAIFIADENQVCHFTAGYGIDNSSLPAFTFAQGRSGETILQRKIVHLNEVPGHSFKLVTGLSEENLYHIVMCPVYFEDFPIGLIELASPKPYSEQTITFLEEAVNRIAIMINSIQTSLRTQELLHETQNQAEELETQQEELRQMNDELKKQKDQLQVSEEELKVSQEELQEKNKELEERAIELEEQYDKIKMKNVELEEVRQAIELKVMQVESISRYKTEFLANMSHELRTPLNSILILSKLMMDEVEKAGLNKQAEHAKVIHSSGNDLLKLINEILDLSKIESGHIRLEIKDLPLKHLNLADEFKQIAKEKSIDYNVDISEDTPEIMVTDEFRLRQILKNLLSNAFKFTPSKGKVSLKIFPYKGKKNFNSANLNDSQQIIAFSISDNGEGIPADKHQLIFEAFQQADNSTTRKFGGTGLGLSISRELAILLGGEIQLQSEVGKGSIFTLYLPDKIEKIAEKTNNKFSISLNRQESIPSQELNVTNHMDEKEKVILVVDDDRGFNNIVAEFARNKKFKVLQAYTGNEALKMLKDKPDAILLDIHLPDMNGLDILKMIRENKGLKNTKVHIMSAYNQAMNDGEIEFDEYLPKPVTLEQIGNAFNKLSRSPIKKVLIVEDNKTENHAISQLLASEQIESVSALSGNEALEILTDRADEIDAVILDLMLPDMDGYQVMEKIRVLQDQKGLPIIIYSGKDLSEQEEIKIKKYANTIIIKNEYSYLRLMDEVKLFLLRMNELLTEKKDGARELHIASNILKGKKVLLVDDDMRNIYSLYNALEQQGMEVVVAHDGKEALQKLEEEINVDIVLMDIMMPEMDGIECTQKIRLIEDYKDLPVIALTAKAMKGDKEKCIQAGASDYLSKPVDMERLISLMRVWVYDRKFKK